MKFEDLLEIFWKSHNPCAKSYSRQYRSAIFYANEDQKKLAMETLAREKKKGAVETAVEPLDTFYNAEDYHQKYYLRQSRFAKEFLQLYSKNEDFVKSTAVMRVNAWLGGHGTREQVKKELPKLGLTEPAGKELLSKVRD